jgi:elongation factor 1-gamma
MSFGTIYDYPFSPRSNWISSLAKYLELDVKTVIAAETADFAKLFPLKKCPAFISSDGFKLTEMIAIIIYFISNSKSKKDFAGSTDKEKALNLRWLSFINSDYINAASIVLKAQSDEEKQKGIEAITNYSKYIDNELANTKYFASNENIFAVDVFAYQVFSCLPRFGIDLASYPNISSFLTNVSTHPIFKE